MKTPMRLANPRTMERSTKVYCRGTQRCLMPAESLAKIEPLLPVMGITRLANITGLDSIGVPVYMACRPNARSLAVFQGKGLDPLAAKVSAAMEAIETFHAESIDLPLKFGSYEELRYSNDLAAVDRLPMSKYGGFDPLQQALWIEACDIGQGGYRWLPFELVHANYTLPAAPGSGAFVANTNGLASGNSFTEALCHGLYEVIERDAVTLWRLSPPDVQDARAIDPATVDDPDGRALLKMFERAGLDVALWDVTSDIGIASVLCLLAGRQGSLAAPELGAGCHRDRGIALCRALTEAAQARTTFIAGSRDDITAENYRPEALAERYRAARETLEATQATRAFGALPSGAGETLEEDLEAICTALAAADLPEVYAVDLTKPVFDIAVARVVVPGLETAFESPDADYVPGTRAMRLLAHRRETGT